jgi:hypothetical protein
MSSLEIHIKTMFEKPKPEKDEEVRKEEETIQKDSHNPGNLKGFSSEDRTAIYDGLSGRYEKTKANLKNLLAIDITHAEAIKLNDEYDQLKDDLVNAGDEFFDFKEKLATMPDMYFGLKERSFLFLFDTLKRQKRNYNEEVDRPIKMDNFRRDAMYYGAQHLVYVANDKHFKKKREKLDNLKGLSQSEAIKLNEKYENLLRKFLDADNKIRAFEKDKLGGMKDED